MGLNSYQIKQKKKKDVINRFKISTFDFFDIKTFPVSKTELDFEKIIVQENQVS